MTAGMSHHTGAGVLNLGPHFCGAYALSAESCGWQEPGAFGLESQKERDGLNQSLSAEADPAPGEFYGLAEEWRRNASSKTWMLRK